MRVIITGADSYIGNSIQTYIHHLDPEFEVHQLDVIGDKWKAFDFSGYDAVVHVAAIVHRKDVEDWELYKRVNADLPAEIARKAKAQGIGQFVFMSSMAVYGVEKTLSKNANLISPQTELKPSSMYGKSKYLAEQYLAEIADEGFRIAIVRAPNVYGPGCRGGYISTYKRIVQKLPVIPKAFTDVRQSVLYIDNLSRLVYLLLVRHKYGVYTPQDDAGLSAVELMQYIAQALGLKRAQSALLGLPVRLLAFLPLVRKGYGGVAYAWSESAQEELDYAIVPSHEGIRRTVLFEER